MSENDSLGVQYVFFEDSAFIHWSDIYIEDLNACNRRRRVEWIGLYDSRIKGVDSIESAEKLRGSVLFIKRSDVSLPEGQYFIDDIIGCEVFDVLSGEKLGVISDVSPTGANDVWHIKRGDKEYLVPAIDEVIVSVDIESSQVVIRPLKGIFDDED